MIKSEYDEVWLVYVSGDLLCTVDSENKAEGICVMLEYATWKRFVAATKQPE
jgi:hypothetical protein